MLFESSHFLRKYTIFLSRVRKPVDSIQDAVISQLPSIQALGSIHWKRVDKNSVSETRYERSRLREAFRRRIMNLQKGIFAT